MFITKGHFLSPYTRVIKNGKTLSMIHSIDTDLMVCIRVVGFDEGDNSPILDLVKCDEVCFVTNNMPSNVEDLIPENFLKVEENEQT